MLSVRLATLCNRWMTVAMVACAAMLSHHSRADTEPSRSAASVRAVGVPNLFWAAGKQPLRVLQPWDQISFPEDGLLPWDALLKAQTTPAHFKTWRQRYQYVLLLNADVGKSIDPAAFPELQLATDAGFARLYIVRTP